MKKLTILTLLAFSLVATNGFAAVKKMVAIDATEALDTSGVLGAEVEIYPAKGSVTKIRGIKKMIDLERDTNIFGKNPKYIKDITVKRGRVTKKLSEMKDQVGYINRMLEQGESNTFTIYIGTVEQKDSPYADEFILKVGIRPGINIG